MLSLKYKVLTLIVLVSSCLVIVSPATINAIACPDGFEGGSVQQIENGSCANHQTGSPANDDIEASDPSAGAVLDADCKETELDKENCGIVGYIVTFTNALAILVGIVIVIMIAVGGIQYTTARDDPQQVSAAKNRIRNAILALVFYLFTFAFLQWLVPGGVF
jgi:hypothetical protein